MLRNRLLIALFLGTLPGCMIRPDRGVEDGDPDLARARDLGPPCVGLQCKVAKCRPGTRTTVTGIVNIPAGNLPLYNATVYVPQTAVAPIPTGASCDRCAEDLSGAPLTKAVTDVQGRFTLVDVPSGNNIPLVIRAGKWRRQVLIPQVGSCHENPLEPELTRLPRNRAEGDIPHMALSTGSADAMECLLRKLGIDDSEFTTDSGDGRVHLYAGAGGTNRFAPALNGGAALTAAQPEPMPSWWDQLDNLLRYDILLLSCEGAQNLQYRSAEARANLQAYIDRGGRVFASHWHQAWLQYGPPPLSTVATWVPGSGDLFSINGTIDAPMDRPLDKRNAFADWLVHVGASMNRGLLPIRNAKYTVASVDPMLTERWVYYQSPMMGTVTQYFQFNAPIGAAADRQCGRLVFSDIHVTGDLGGDRSTPAHPFPTGCVTMALTPQEKALIFMLFDLTNCLDPILG